MTIGSATTTLSRRARLGMLELFQMGALRVRVDLSLIEFMELKI